MDIKYNVTIENEAIIKNIERITNQIFKLLPNREEGGDWESPLQNLILELVGMNRLLINQTLLFSLLCKMESLLTLTDDEDFFIFRKLIFECLGLLKNLKISLS